VTRRERALEVLAVAAVVARVPRRRGDRGDLVLLPPTAGRLLAADDEIAAAAGAGCSCGASAAANAADVRSVVDVDRVSAPVVEAGLVARSEAVARVVDRQQAELDPATVDPRVPVGGMAREVVRVRNAAARGVVGGRAPSRRDVDRVSAGGGNRASELRHEAAVEAVVVAHPDDVALAAGAAVRARRRGGPLRVTVRGALSVARLLLRVALLPELPPDLLSRPARVLAVQCSRLLGGARLA
jgi:hypothetical protein